MQEAERAAAGVRDALGTAGPDQPPSIDPKLDDLIVGRPKLVYCCP